MTAFAAATTLGACAQIAGLSDFVRASDDDETSSGNGAAGAGAGALGGGGAGGGGAGGGSVSCNTDDLVISELRTEGTAGLKDDFVEIFNPTSSPIDLGGYTISARSPTSNEGSDMARFVGMPGQTIPAYGHLLVAGDTFDDTNADATFLGGVSLGNDTLLFLNKDGARLDIVCVCADHCGERSWSECGGVLIENPATAVPKDISLHRSPACVDTDDPKNFVAGDSSPLGLTSPPTPP